MLKQYSHTSVVICELSFFKCLHTLYIYILVDSLLPQKYVTTTYYYLFHRQNIYIIYENILNMKSCHVNAIVMKLWKKKSKILILNNNNNNNNDDRLTAFDPGQPG